MREADLRAPKQRAGRYRFEMGEEMQFDTSPHRLKLNDHAVKAQCASLVLAWSRRIFIRYFPCFTRFEAKAFLREALCFMDGSASRCLVDNSNVMVASGSGEDAVMAPEMAAFGQIFGFEFVARGRRCQPQRPGGAPVLLRRKKLPAGTSVQRLGRSERPGPDLVRSHRQSKTQAFPRHESAGRLCPGETAIAADLV